MALIRAVYENGVELRSVSPGTDEQRLDALYAILEARFESGEVDVAATHDKHQP